MAIGTTTSSDAEQHQQRELGREREQDDDAGDPEDRLRSATETVVPTTCSMIVVSTVIRDVISAGRFSSKKPGERRSRLRCTARRMSATVRSPSQETK